MGLIFLSLSLVWHFKLGLHHSSMLVSGLKSSRGIWLAFKQSKSWILLLREVLVSLFKAFIVESILSNLPLEEGTEKSSLAKVRMLVYCDANGAWNSLHPLLSKWIMI